MTNIHSERECVYQLSCDNWSKLPLPSESASIWRGSTMENWWKFASCIPATIVGAKEDSSCFESDASCYCWKKKIKKLEKKKIFGIK